MKMMPPPPGWLAPSLAKTPEQLLAGALQRLRDGRHTEAEPLLGELLKQQPRHFDALHMLGVCLHQRGDYAQAVKRLRAALNLRPGNALAHANLGNALRESKQLMDAIASYRRATMLDPQSADACYNLATALEEAGNHPEAMTAYERALQLRPADAEACCGRANCLQALGRDAEALEGYHRAIELEPQLASAHANRGAVLLAAGQHEEALASLDRAVRLQPDQREWRLNGARALKALGRHREAVECFRLALGPGEPPASVWADLAESLLELQQDAAALDCLERALAAEPRRIEALINQAIALARLGRHDEALQAYAQALAVDPNDGRALANHGNALVALGRYEEARSLYERAIEVDPDTPMTRWNRSLCLLIQGDFENGWREYEWRRKDPRIASGCREFAQPSWLGQQDLAGRTLLLHAEQGLGDALQFSRYAPALAARAGKVVLEVHPPLAGLLERSLAPQVQVVRFGEPLPQFDLHCPLLSLPYACGTTLQTVPAQVPYLHADPQRRAFWSERLGQRTRPRIGLVWSGRLQHRFDALRSIALAQFEPLADLPMDFVGLQTELREADRPALGEFANLTWLGNSIRDFDDTAAIVGELDLVISVDTSVVHLAGALGAPVWVLLAYSPDYRWLLDRDDSPWYPTARLFRQRAPANWQPVIDRVRSELIRAFET